MTKQDAAPDMAGMQDMAEAMMAAGCEAVIGLLKGGHAVLAVADNTDPKVLATILRGYAAAIDGLDEQADLIGRVHVEVEE